MKIGVLTSSRADYGIYLPLLKAIKEENSFELRLIVFGAHLSKMHGYTINDIIQDGFTPYALIENLLIGDSPNSISSSFAITSLKFSEFWNQTKNQFDIVFCLGDRFEMAAAVLSAIPYGINFAHLHGGETTFGAIDNIYRHCISLASKLHFASTDHFASRIQEILGNHSDFIYNIGSLSLENIGNIKLLSKEEFNKKWNIDFQLKTILLTVHPETVEYEKNDFYSTEISEAINELSEDYQVIITLPNADTASFMYREKFLNLGLNSSNVKIVENFGTQSYFSCMKLCDILLGNSSSGIIEAASFGKYVINLGQRQAGRLCSANVVHIPFDKNAIVSNTNELITREFKGENIYYKANPSKKIIEIIKSLHG
jgi:GDP/UDP-N,N'-diacetylbacillosamine 2-epimerase (hydrolysing)